MALGLIVPGSALAAEEVRISDKAGSLLSAVAIENHGQASVSVTVDSTGGSKPVELVLTGGKEGTAVSRAFVKDGEGVFDSVSAGSYRLFATPADARIVAVRVTPGAKQDTAKASNHDTLLNAGAIAAAAAGTAGLIIGGASIADSDSGSVSLSAGSSNEAGTPGRGGAASVTGSSAGVDGTAAASTRARVQRRISPAPSIGTISPAPSSSNTVINDTPDEIGGSSGPGQGNDAPTEGTPNPPAPENPPPLSGS